MELASDTFSKLSHPTAAFIDITSKKEWLSGTVRDQHNETFKLPTETPWEFSSLNPKNRVDNLNTVLDAQWEIHGCGDWGRQYFAIARFQHSHTIPSMIDVYIPHHYEHPPELHKCLQTSHTFATKDSSISQLGIVRLVLRALNQWTSQQPDFEARYKSLRFGSRIVFQNISSNPCKMRIDIVENRDLEHLMATPEWLKQVWKIPEEQWPATIDLENLCLHRRVHDSINIVTIPSCDPLKMMVFKTKTNTLKYLYHELKMLLTMPAHPNIIARPIFVVTTAIRRNDKVVKGVCGFILEYHVAGTFRDILPNKAKNENLYLKDQFKWARQIVAVHQHLRQNGSFYSDLKLDNLLLTTNEDIVFVDFEQHGNWIAWSAPEIHFLEYLERLATSTKTPLRDRVRYQKLLNIHLPNRDSGSQNYKNPDQGYYSVWIAATPDERESAQAYAIGKILWCIFEGQGSIGNLVTRSYWHDSDLEFPEFRKTPIQIRKCILDCTKGPHGWTVPSDGVYRKGVVVYPRGKTGLNGEPQVTAADTQEAATMMWRRELDDMEVYLATRVRMYQDTLTDEDLNYLAFTKRPSFEDIAALLKNAEIELTSSLQ